MTNARDLPAAIQWHEGMLLTPQHFQQADLRQRALLHHHTALLSPFHWGIRRLEIDPELLGQGTFQVLEIEALMPDGLIVSRALGDTDDLTLDLTPLIDEMRRQPVTIHLAVAAAHSGPSATGDELARYDSVEGRPVADANTGEGEVAIPRLRPRLRLLATEDPPKKFVSLPLARIVHRDEAFAQAQFIPPILRVGRSSPLGKLCLQVATRLREKANQLAEQTKSTVAAERAPQLLEKKISAHSLASALPPFEALLYTGTAHPYTLYLALCTVVGQVAIVGHSLVPPVLPPYDHNDPLRSFAEARHFIAQTLREGIPESYDGFPFYLEGESFFIAFDRAWRSQPLVLGVRGRPGVTGQETADWVGGSLIASQSRMAEIESKRIRGAGRRPVQSAGDLVPTRDVSLYALDDDPEFVVTDELLQIQNRDDPDGRRRPLEIILYVRKQS